MVLWHWQKGNSKTLWILPLATLLWANLHGSFVLAFVLMGSALVFGAGDRKICFLVRLFLVLGTLINPRGPVLAYLSSACFLAFRSIVCQEWRPPRQRGLADEYLLWLDVASHPTCGVISAAPILLEWVWFLGFGWLALFRVALCDLVHVHDGSLDRQPCWEITAENWTANVKN